MVKNTKAKGTFDGHTVEKNVVITNEDAIVEFELPTTITGFEELETIPLGYGLKQNFPNPFNTSTVIEFMPEQSGDAELKIYNTRGVQVFSKSIKVTRGIRCQEKVSFDDLTTGSYFYSVLFPNGKQSMKKMMLMK